MYDPNLHHRKSIRLRDYDYSQAGLYFITICGHNNKCRFGIIENGEMILNEYGSIASKEWERLPERYSHTALDVYQIMPNHIHGVLHITDTIPGFASCNEITGAYKSLVFNACLEIYESKNETMGKFWQRNFYEHIIRNETSYQTIANYIINNPQNWQTDKFYTP